MKKGHLWKKSLKGSILGVAAVFEADAHVDEGAAVEEVFALVDADAEEVDGASSENFDYRAICWKEMQLEFLLCKDSFWISPDMD